MQFFNAVTIKHIPLQQMQIALCYMMHMIIACGIVLAIQKKGATDYRACQEFKLCLLKPCRLCCKL